MPSLKQYRVRIKSVKSTQKITKAMKMVAAAKLRRAKDNAEVARPYAEKMEALLAGLASGMMSMQEASSSVPLLTGNGKNKVHLLIVATSDRGLCGGFNSSIVRAARRKAIELMSEGKDVRFYCIGKKSYEQLSLAYRDRIVSRVTDLSRKKKPEFTDADRIARDLIDRFDNGEFDVATIIYNHFQSAISQLVTFQQLVPLPSESTEARSADRAGHEPPKARSMENSGEFSGSSVKNNTPYEYEPDEETLLKELLPRNLATQIYRAFLENAASEQGARMTAMDNATRNAGEMIKKLTLSYNRQRQAAITKELIEIISGAEAL